MRLLLLLLGMLVFHSSPVYYTQVVYTVPLSKDIIKTDDLYIYKGDSLDIVYSFWADGGVMAFMMINKSRTPIYIDWTKSAYADSKTTEQYYPVYKSGNSISDVTDVYKTSADWYRLFTPYILSGYVGAENGAVSEPVTMLPPKSYLFRGNYRILPTTTFSVKKLRPTNIPFISGMRESFPGWVMENDSTNTPYAFSNKITYAHNNDFRNAKYINNQFYVWQVLTFEESYFDGYDKETNSLNCPYHSDKRYFISHLKISDFD